MADIEFVDREFGQVRVPISRKIKFKQVSFTNISERFNNFRLNRLKSKLISQKEKLVSMEFKGSHLVPGNSRERVEKKVLNKTAAIARLESKINFLETGNYLTEDFVNSRAIKLKETMMNNLEYNRGNLYGVNKDTKEVILNEPDEVEDIVQASTTASTISTDQEPENTSLSDDAQNKQMLENQEQIAAKVQQIMGNNQSKEETEITPPPIIPVVPMEPFSPAESDAITRDEVASTIADEMDKMESVKPINAEELAEAINEEMQKIKVSSNESTPAKVNKFINDDGKYHLKREDMDENFRITRVDHNELSKSVTNAAEEIQVPEVEPFGAGVERKVPSMGLARRAVTEIPEAKKYVIEPLAAPTIKESFFVDVDSSIDTKEQVAEDAIDANREIALVVPERESGEIPSYEAPKEGVKTMELNNEIQKILNKATVLRKDQEMMQVVSETEAEALQQTSQRYNETLGQFKNYVNNLEDECNETYKNLQEIREQKQIQEEQINMMVCMMAGNPLPEVAKSK